MASAQNLLLACCFLLSGISGVISQAKSSLRLVQIVYRHGDRSPTSKYPNDNYTEATWPQGFGQLTQLGMQQQFDLGKYFRKRYNGFLNETYIRKEVYVRSTDIDRTLMSAYSNLAGLYPPAGRQVWNANISWQPIPVHTVPADMDYLLLGDNCALYSYLLGQVRDSQEYKDLTTKYQDLLNLVKEKGGYPTATLENAWKIYDPLFCEIQHGLPQPSWVNTAFPQVVSVYNKFLAFANFNDEMVYLKGGPLLTEVVSRMVNKSQGTEEVKAYFYSAHDSTVAAFMNALRVWNNLQPPYTASVIIELHEDQQNQYHVEMYYKNESNHEAYPLNLTGCVNPCPLDRFIKITANMQFKGDWQAACNQLPFHMTKSIIIGMVIIVILAILCSGFALVVCFRTRVRKVPYQQANFNTTQEL